MSYFSLQSGEQIKAIMNSYLRKSFVNFIYKRLNISRNLFYKIYLNSSNDFEIYEKLMKYKRLKFKSKEEAFKFRAKKRIKDFEIILNKINRHSFSRYIDLGSDDCVITNAIANYLQIDKDNCFATDIVDKCKEEEVTFIKLIPFKHSKLFVEDNLETFDLITAFQSMHHTEDINFRLKELTSLCENDAIFIIREHDAMDNTLKMFIDIEHLIYEVIIDEIDIDTFINSYYAKYFNKEELTSLMLNFNFKKIYESELFGETKYYYSAYILIE